MMKKHITVVGARGDLGSKLVNQGLQCGYSVSEIDLVSSTVGIECVDPHLELTVKRPEMNVGKLEEISGIVHWCASLNALEYINTSNVELLVLHDSVMAQSETAKKKIKNINVAVVHVTTNIHRAVFVSDSSDMLKESTNHIVSLGLEPIVIASPKHDMIMAKSQGLIALLCKTLQTDLELFSELGFLTPSGDELLHALQHRSATWTEITMDSIMCNPKSEKVLNSMHKFLKKHSNEKH
jgi:hypothetical protein